MRKNYGLNNIKNDGDLVMDTKEFLEKVAYVDDTEICGSTSKVYKSKFDDSYMTHVGMEENVDFLADREVTEELTHGVGFSPKDEKWYGWSHRAIYGFKVGSKCNKGDCHYKPIDKDDFLDDMVRFWSDENHENTKGKHTTQEIMAWEAVNPGEPEQKPIPTGKLEHGVYVEWTYSNETPNEAIRKTISGVFSPYPESFGRGEWVAKTMGDAKQMAQDFNEGVS